MGIVQLLGGSLRRGFSVVIVTLIAPSWILAQSRMITGKVTEKETSAPLANVQIVVRSTTASTISREDGSFSFRLPANVVVLDVRRIGYKPLVVSVAVDMMTLSLTMERDVLKLNEVVVTGVGTGVTRRNLAVAVSTVDASELIQAPAASFEQMLAGKVAGADIQSNSGAPGGGGQIRLRGISSINGASTPLYIIDGVIASDVSVSSGVSFVTRSSADRVAGGRQDNSANRISDINPNDIENIEILKGAAASAIYGSRANNGVILITTKRGKVGAPRVNLIQRIGRFEQARVLGIRRFATLSDAVATYGARANTFFQDTAFFDHEAALAGATPFGNETVLSIGGGSPTTRFYVSGTNKRDGGIISNTYFNRRALAVNLDQTLGERLNFRVSTNATQTENGRGVTNNDNAGVSLFAAVARAPSFVDLRQRPDGSWPTNPFGNSNPLETAARTRNIERVYRFIGSTAVTWTALRSATQEFRLLANGGADFFNQKNELFSPPGQQFEPLDGLNGTSVLGNAQNLNLNLNLNGVHVWRVDDGKTLTATSSFGYQYEQRGLGNAQIVSQGLIGGLQNVARSTAVQVFQDISLTRDQGLFAQHELLWRDRLLVTGGFRADRSANNSATEKFFVFPKAAASYRLGRVLPGVDEVKVRTAWGQSGNQPLFGQKYTEFLAANVSGLPAFSVAGQWSAADVRPERQSEVEGGFDIALLGGRASLEVSGYQKIIDDLLLTRTPALSTGYAVQIFNGGQIRTRGAEALFRAIPLQRRRFEWTSTTTFSMERSIATKLPIPPFRPPSFGTQAGAFQIEEGKSLGQIIGNDSLPNGTLVVRPVADAIPRFRMGFQNTFRSGPVSLFVLADWQAGGITSNRQRFFYDLNGASLDCNVRAPDPNPLNESVCRRRNRLYAKQTSIYLEDATFLKFREISLAFDVPARLVERWWGAGRTLRASVAGRNLWWITDYTGFDPEASNFGSQAVSRGIDSPGFPPARSVWFSLDVSF